MLVTNRIGIYSGETPRCWATAGARWENASEALLDRLGVRRVGGRAVRLVRSKECWEVCIFDGEVPILARAAVLASGVLSSAEEAAAREVPPAPTPPFPLSFHGPMVLALVASGEALPGRLAAGELASDEAAAMLPSMATGLDAGIAAAAFAAG
jgi:hypothetical protein